MGILPTEKVNMIMPGTDPSIQEIDPGIGIFRVPMVPIKDSKPRAERNFCLDISKKLLEKSKGTCEYPLKRVSIYPKYLRHCVPAIYGSGPNAGMFQYPVHIGFSPGRVYRKTVSL